MDYQELNSVWTIKREYERGLQRLEDLHCFALPASPPIDGLPSNPPPLSSKVETIATLIIELEADLWGLAAELERRRYRLAKALQAEHIKELLERVLIFHYADCRSFNAIAKLMNFSRRYILDLHEAGLNALGLDAQEMIQFRKSCGVRD